MACFADSQAVTEFPSQAWALPADENHPGPASRDTAHVRRPCGFSNRIIATLEGHLHIRYLIGHFRVANYQMLQSRTITTNALGSRWLLHLPHGRRVTNPRRRHDRGWRVPGRAAL